MGSHFIFVMDLQRWDLILGCEIVYLHFAAQPFKVT